MAKELSVCLVTCYAKPKYIRVRSLEAGLLANDISLTIVRNKWRGIIRYIEVILKLIKTRLLINPDVYIVTFRGYEILPFVLIIGFRKKVIFDEFINLVEWVTYEHRKLKAGSLGDKVLMVVYRFMLQKTTKIITDTKSHAEYSADLMSVPISKYWVVPVGNDESVFANVKTQNKKNDGFNVLYYGSMLPLHGVDVVIDAMGLLRGENISLTLIGGNRNTEKAADDAIKSGLNIQYKKWVDFEDLPRYIKESDICLAGPFGGTVQAQYVITGKAYQFLYMSHPIIIGENKESHIFNNKKDAIIVKQSNPKELAKAIKWASNNRDKLPIIGRAGYAVYQRQLSNKILKYRLRELLGQL